MVTSPSTILIALIRSRCHVVEVQLTQRELLEFIEREVLPRDYPGTSIKDRRYVFGRFSQAVADSASKISIRTFRQLLDLYVLDHDNFDLHAAELLPQSDDVRLLRGLLDRNMLVEDAAHEFQIATGKSRRTFFILKARYRDVLGL